MTKDETRTRVDLEAALLDPGSVFATPEEIVAHAGLTQEQKIEILRRWEYDAAEIDVALEEGMPGDDSGLLRRILLALEQLAPGVVGHRTGPTKQRGLPESSAKPK